MCTLLTRPAEHTTANSFFMTIFPVTADHHMSSLAWRCPDNIKWATPLRMGWNPRDLLGEATYVCVHTHTLSLSHKCTQTEHWLHLCSEPPFRDTGTSCVAVEGCLLSWDEPPHWECPVTGNRKWQWWARGAHTVIPTLLDRRPLLLAMVQLILPRPAPMQVQSQIMESFGRS